MSEISVKQNEGSKWVKGQIMVDIAGRVGGPPRLVEAECWKVFAVHSILEPELSKLGLPPGEPGGDEETGDKFWGLTHIPTGYKIAQLISVDDCYKMADILWSRGRTIFELQDVGKIRKKILPPLLKWIKDCRVAKRLITPPWDSQIGKKKCVEEGGVQP